MRTLALTLALVMAAGCGTAGPNNNRRLARNILIGTTVLAGASAIASGVISEQKESDLRDDLQAGTLTGAEFAIRDDDGRKWNRIGRASIFLAGLSLVGLGILWEMSLTDRLEQAPAMPGDLVPLPASPAAPAAAGH